MSTLAVNRLARELERDPVVIERLAADRDAVLGSYDLSVDERAAIDGLDAAALLTSGVNPVVIRNLFVLLGVSHRDLYRRV